jgi:hypothetical protein
MLVMITADKDKITPYTNHIMPPHNCNKVKGKLISLALFNLKSFHI